MSRAFETLGEQAPALMDPGSALFGVTLLGVALAGLWLWRRLRGERGFGAREVLFGLVIATFLNSGSFWVRKVLPRLTHTSVAFSRELDPSGQQHAFARFLADVDAAMPEGDGVVLVNCKGGVVADQTNYMLYPRRVVLRWLSMLPMGDPRELLTDERATELRAVGASWVLDLDPAVWPQGVAAALIPLEAGR